jgi:hypothetical protein
MNGHFIHIVHFSVKISYNLPNVKDFYQTDYFH